MNTNRQVGKLVANIPPTFGDVGKLENACQLSIHNNQSVTELSANWQVGSAANLPTSQNPHDCWVGGDFEVGENSPSYYDQVELTGFRPLALPHHRTCGFPHPAVESSELSRKLPRQSKTIAI